LYIVLELGVRLRQGQRHYWRTGCWGNYQDLRSRKWKQAEEICKVRSFIVGTPRQTLWGW